ncbi:CsiV family protein [Pseudomonas sp. nanlin1]|uniref:CsiV family protein n=1 Tax=Pseudomonas sp. nanlin1 TaxID=3040605 RepID=UPI00388E6869
MRRIHTIALLLALLTPLPSLAADYQVEVVLFRQNAVPVISAPPATEGWAEGAQNAAALPARSPALNNEVSRLQASGNYTVLTHKAWQQSLGEQAVRTALSDGDERYGRSPVQGLVTLNQGRFTEVAVDFWVSELDAGGQVLHSERLKQSSRMKPGELNFIDGGHLAALVKVTPL